VRFEEPVKKSGRYVEDWFTGTATAVVCRRVIQHSPSTAARPLQHRGRTRAQETTEGGRCAGGAGHQEWVKGLAIGPSPTFGPVLSAVLSV